MGQTIYVLTNLEGADQKAKYREWRPIGVVTSPDAATSWASESPNHDWIPFEMDDLPEGDFTSFSPKKQAPVDQRAIETAKRLEQVNARLMKIIEELQKRLRIKMDKVERPPAGRVRSSLLKKADKAAPKPNGFPERLAEDRDIADYIETWATYEVDPEFVEEQFRGERAELRLMPISGLIEGGRDHNLQSPANERKYQRMKLETMPPLLVRDGKVLDGNHRLRACKKRGLTHVWCYDVVADTGGEDEQDGEADASGGS